MKQPLIALLVDPRLDGAACTGLGHLFELHRDGETDSAREQRHHHARTICRTCPTTRACHQAATDLGHRAEGIWAGQLHGKPPRTPGRPKENRS